MSMLTKPYELSVWKDVIVKTINAQDAGVINVEEQKCAVISSDKMLTQNKAQNIKIVRNINGQVTVTFTMYKKYRDNISGKLIDNPFVSIVTNETKLKLKHGTKWYDLIVKSCKESSNKSAYEYSATDMHINELSKNGFNLELTNDLYNNQGSIIELGQRILKDTGWEVDVDASHLNCQTVEESLIRLVIH